MFISSSGITLAAPPPVPPPFIPNMGPNEGSLRVATTFLPNSPMPWANPTAVVVLPSPAGVGVIPVTTINFPVPLFLLEIVSKGIFALKSPYIINF